MGERVARGRSPGDAGGERRRRGRRPVGPEEPAGGAKRTPRGGGLLREVIPAIPRSGGAKTGLRQGKNTGGTPGNG